MIRIALSALFLCLLAALPVSEDRNAWTTPHALTIADWSEVDMMDDDL